MKTTPKDVMRLYDLSVSCVHSSLPRYNASGLTFTYIAFAASPKLIPIYTEK